MSPAPIRPVDKKTETAKTPRRHARANALRNAQVMPPHNVDLPLPPVAHEDVHVPAHVTGTDLSTEGPAAAGDPKTGRRSH